MFSGMPFRWFENGLSLSIAGFFLYMFFTGDLFCGLLATGTFGFNTGLLISLTGIGTFGLIGFFKLSFGLVSFT